MAYERVNWENAPSTETPLSAENLNAMDSALANIDGRVSASAEAIESLQQDVDLLDARLDTIVTRPEGATGIHNVIDGGATGSVRTTGGIDSGDNTLGDYAFAEGNGTKATGNSAHAEGYNTTSTGDQSHAEGFNTAATGDQSHTEGFQTAATGLYAHAEGFTGRATANASHAEGVAAIASGLGSHAEGSGTTASGYHSHAEGTNNIAKFKSQHVFGEYNAIDPSDAGSDNRGTYVEIIGNGTSNSNRSNARTLDWEGNEKIAGSLTIGMGTANEVTITPAQLIALLALLS